MIPIKKALNLKLRFPLRDCRASTTVKTAAHKQQRNGATKRTSFIAFLVVGIALTGCLCFAFCGHLLIIHQPANSGLLRNASLPSTSFYSIAYVRNWLVRVGHYAQPAKQRWWRQLRQRQQIRARLAATRLCCILRMQQWTRHPHARLLRLDGKATSSLPESLQRKSC